MVHFFNKGVMFVQISSAENYHKFISANAVDGTGFECIAQNFCRVNDQFVAYIVTVGVICFLQIVYIGHQHAE